MTFYVVVLLSSVILPPRGPTFLVFLERQMLPAAEDHGQHPRCDGA